MRMCPQCRTAYPAAVRRCTRDGTPTVDARELAESRGDPLIGVVIAGRFKVVERVGVGGMGTVYKAVQSGLNRDVALKILKREMSWDRETVTRFHREAKAMSLLTHPNTVRVYDFGQTQEGLLYLAMELLEGELLTDKLDRLGVLDVPDAIRICQQILGSLHEAHQKGIIHRDLKPDNIYLARIEGSPAPVVKVLDFGIAKAWHGEKKLDQLETQAGTVFGTPRYMSPEQAQGNPLDPRSDLYSVGVLLYQLVSGRQPFVDEEAVVVMAKHIRERPDSLRRAAVGRAVGSRLDRAVLRALEKEPDARYRDASTFIAELEACIPEAERLEQTDGKVGFGTRVLDFFRDHPRLPVAVGVGLLAVTTVAVGYVAVASGPADADAVVADPLPPTATPPALDTEPPGIDYARLTSEPPGAEVWDGDDRLGTTPLELPMPSDTVMRVELRLEGHRSANAQLIADGEQRTARLSPAEPDEAVPEDDDDDQRRASAPRRPTRVEPVEPPPPAMEPPRREEPYVRFD